MPELDYLLDDDETWERAFSELGRFFQASGHYRVPLSGPDAPLGRWVRQQRVGVTHSHRLSRLQAIGCPVDKLGDKWEDYFVKLLRYKQSTGHCNVPHKWSEDIPFSKWVTYQRSMAKSGKLPPLRRRRLEVLGFDADPFETEWQRNFESFRKNDFHAADESTRRWVEHQREGIRLGKLSAHRRDQLLRLPGFAVSPRDAFWEEMFAAFLTVKGQMAEYFVPKDYAPNPSLGIWAHTQRQARAHNELSGDRFDRLTAAGFLFVRAGAVSDGRGS